MTEPIIRLGSTAPSSGPPAGNARPRDRKRSAEEALRKLQTQLFYLVDVIVALQGKINAT